MDRQDETAGAGNVAYLGGMSGLAGAVAGAFISEEKRTAYEAQERERRLNEAVAFLQKAEEIRADPALMAEVKAHLRNAGGKVERLLKSLGA